MTDDGREASLAAAPALQPNFSAPSVTTHQLLKLQELRRKRLQLKSNSSRPKQLHSSKSSKTAREERGEGGTANNESSTTLNHGGSQAHLKKTVNVLNTCQGLHPNSSCVKMEASSLKKRQKLHWGLDTKERWERKGNM